MVETAAPDAVYAAVLKVVAECKGVQMMHAGECQGQVSGTRRPSLPLKRSARQLRQCSSVLWFNPRVEAWQRQPARVLMANSLEAPQRVVLTP